MKHLEQCQLRGKPVLRTERSKADKQHVRPAFYFQSSFGCQVENAGQRSQEWKPGDQLDSWCRLQLEAMVTGPGCGMGCREGQTGEMPGEKNQGHLLMDLLWSGVWSGDLTLRFVASEPGSVRRLCFGEVLVTCPGHMG